MYSTNLEIQPDGRTIGSRNSRGEYRCEGVSYGWTTLVGDGEEEVADTRGRGSSQTAKDNALLWSLAPEMVELLKQAYETGGLANEWWHQCDQLFIKLAHAIPPASVAADA